MKYKALGADIFAGGFSCGVQEYFNVEKHFEHSNYGKNIKDLNMPHVETVLPPWPIEYNIDFIFANPPCAPFSTASHGRSTPWYEDERLNCFNDCYNLIYNYPQVLAIESVLAAWRKGSEYLLDKCYHANGLGYNATIVLHNCHWVGLPQTRRRMFLVLHQVELAWYTFIPTPIMSCDYALVNPPVDYDGGGDAVLQVDAHTEYLFKHRTDSDNTLLQIHDRLGFGKGVGSKRPVYTSSICKPGKSAPTLLHCMHMHPTEPRFLSVREIARLSGYPDWWSWEIPVGPQTKSSLIARGVTPITGEWLAKLVHQSLDDSIISDKPTTQVADFTSGVLKITDYAEPANGTIESVLTQGECELAID